MDKTFLLVGAVAAFLAVTLGAFGAHGLRARLSPEMMAVFVGQGEQDVEGGSGQHALNYSHYGYILQGYRRSAD